MAANALGRLRRSSALLTFGPGAVVDFRADGAPVSAVTAGLEEWDRSFPPAGLANSQRIFEPRLQRKLSVAGFRLPPVADETARSKDGQPDRRALVAVRFPNWLHCSRCSRLAPTRRWPTQPGRAYRYCARCTSQAPGQRKVFAVPARFVMACARGHLDDFPWHSWVQHDVNCQRSRSASLRLQSERPGLAGLILSCPECKVRRSMQGVFSARVWRSHQCRGRRPWLPAENEACDSRPRPLQRGASNLYFPVISSALSIPPWSDVLQESLGHYWNMIVDAEPAARPTIISVAQSQLQPAMRELGLTEDELAQQIEARLARYADDSILNIRAEEYHHLVSGHDVGRRDRDDFETRMVPIPANLRPFFSRIVRVVRLREVRVLRGFTRINPPDRDRLSEMASLSARRRNWLPGIEVRGEGIFLGLDGDALRPWESQEGILRRAGIVDDVWRASWRERHGAEGPSWRVTARYLLIHSLAHALMRQLTLECGYSFAALRERLYVSDGEDDMAGLLVYTATSDSDGTLGGLQRQGEAVHIERTVGAAIRAMEWCSGDPLCVERMTAGADRLSLAACHACSFAPETACEEHNRFLDRAMLVGLPEARGIGFFAGLLDGG